MKPPTSEDFYQNQNLRTLQKMSVIAELLANRTPEQIRSNATTLNHCARILYDINMLQIKIACAKASERHDRRHLIELNMMQNQLDMLWIDYEEMAKLVR